MKMDGKESLVRSYPFHQEAEGTHSTLAGTVSPWSGPKFKEAQSTRIPQTQFQTKLESDPNGLNAKEPGSKLDAGKCPVMQGVLQYFPRALLAVGEVSVKGAEKYSWKGWEKVSDGPLRYGNALARHILYEDIEGPYDKQTGFLHATHEAWNALARLELILKEMENK